MQRTTLYAALCLAAISRLLLQNAALPPYAGLDEIFHVARLAFVAAEGRSPSTSEPSIPRYLDASIDREWSAIPAFCVVGAEWPAVVAMNPLIIRDRVIHDEDLRPYGRTNYEAQQTSLYYIIAAPLAGLTPKTQLSELRLWRLFSLGLALAVVLATAWTGEHFRGPSGILAGALVLSLPTWLTLVVRASNDALACAIAAVAVAVSVSGPKRRAGILAEGLLWALAVNAKLYTVPLLAGLAVFWIVQRATRQRILFVVGCVAAGALATLGELSARTRNPLGIVAFDRPGGQALDAPVSLSEILRVTIASGAWTSGQHWDALTPRGIALYLGPVLFAIGVAMVCRKGSAEGRLLPTAALACTVAFAATQVANTISCVLARRAGNPVPIGGKEGWYWYVLVPVAVPAILAAVLAWQRWAALFLSFWLVLWDVIIHEAVLFHDFAGTRSPGVPGLLFRWGPLRMPFTATLGRIGVGPLASHLVLLRAIHLCAVAVILTGVWRSHRITPAEEQGGHGRRRSESERNPLPARG